jgi:hypothetical protein
VVARERDFVDALARYLVDHDVIRGPEIDSEPAERDGSAIRADVVASEDDVTMSSDAIFRARYVAASAVVRIGIRAHTRGAAERAGATLAARNSPAAVVRALWSVRGRDRIPGVGFAASRKAARTDACCSNRRGAGHSNEHPRSRHSCIVAHSFMRVVSSAALSVVPSHATSQIAGAGARLRAEATFSLAALVAPPRYPLVRYAGVLGPRSTWRRDIVPKPRERRSTRDDARGKHRDAGAPTKRTEPMVASTPRRPDREARGCTIVATSARAVAQQGDVVATRRT